MKKQICNVCNKEKSIGKFEWAKNRPNPRKTCIKCRQEARVFTEEQRKQRSKKQSEWYFENKEKARMQAIFRNYGLSEEGYMQMMINQNNKCAICLNTFESPRTTHVDHCHDTGSVRGILCSTCNTGLGMFKDSPKLLESAINYIAPHFEIAR